ncbi:thioesterase [Streptomyces sp. RKND-216]|uniref:thioesterase II family protein n=1 Tax=Streptomyces sp. RKND-216 TaxID=2562581 RepID=UPI00109E2318|nr:alpha/beta fold hydrolase [Streptomyces sp. RKND-216]THA25976.1 thioesterase [Streptomyces sp. RKND-216]
MRRLVTPLPRPWATHRLICLPYAGGGTVGFRAWARKLPSDVELRVLCYPGREFRYGEQIVGGWQGLIADCADAVAAEVRTPYLLYGHSMGALAAYDVALRLEGGAGAAPESLLLSGHVAPQHVTGVRAAALAAASDAELAAWLRLSGGAAPDVLDDPELCAMAVEMLRMDLTAYVTYRHDPRRRLRAGLHVMTGRDEVTPQHQDWDQVTDGTATFETLPGGHFFTPRVWASLPRRMPFTSGPQLVGSPAG